MKTRDEDFNFLILVSMLAAIIALFCFMTASWGWL